MHLTLAGAVVAISSNGTQARICPNMCALSACMPDRELVLIGQD